jgi:hypothetical protein
MAWTKAQALPFVGKRVIVTYKAEVAILIYPPPPDPTISGQLTNADDAGIVIQTAPLGSDALLPPISIPYIKIVSIVEDTRFGMTQAGLFGFLSNPWALAAIGLGTILAYQTWGPKTKKAR